MIQSDRRIDETMALARSLRRFGCSVETVPKFLFKTGRYPQEASKDDGSHAARLETLPDPYIPAYRAFDVANDD